MISLRIEGVEAAVGRVRDWPRQVRHAASRALKDTAYSVRDEVRNDLRRVFDRPTPYIVSSIRVTRTPTPDSLEAAVAPDDFGGKTVHPANVLRASVYGGARKAKRSEVAFRRAGILPNGLAMVPATWLVDSAAGDGYGGVKGSFVVRLLSYFQAFGEVGSKANMVQRTKDKLSGRGKWGGKFLRRGTKAYAASQGPAAYRKGGVEYFVSKGRGTLKVSRKSALAGKFADGQEQHLPAGIWQRMGLYGEDVKPVFLFVRQPRYTARLDMRATAARVLQREFPGRMRVALDAALATAR